jgi:hypothetical protein
MGRGVMKMTPDEIEAIFLQLDAEDQAAHIGASWVARAAGRRTEKGVADLPHLIDPETEAAFALIEPIEDRLLRHVTRSRSVGIEDEVLGGFLASELSSLGYSDTEEVEKLIAESGIDWHFRTADERRVAAISDLLAMGMEPKTVRAAFAGLEVA